MKVGIFADSHYCLDELRCANRRPILSLSKIRKALAFFKEQNVDMCMCLGDITDSSKTKEESYNCLKEIMIEIEKSGIPFCCLSGNHDYVDYSAEEFFNKTLSPIPPYVFEATSHNFIVLDANYRSDYRRFDIAGVDWTDSNLPPNQVEFLEKALENSKKPCIICIHENLDYNVEKRHIVKNADVIRKIIEQSKKVSLVIQGHYHLGADNIINGIRYYTVPAMCEGEQNTFALLEIDNDKILIDKIIL